MKLLPLPQLLRHFGLLPIIIVLAACKPTTTEAEAQHRKSTRIFCDAETVVDTKTGPRFINDSVYFNHGQNRSESFAYSGSASAFAVMDRSYSMTLHLNDMKEGEDLLVRVRRHSSSTGGKLVVAANRINLLHEATKTAVDGEQDKGWDLLELRLQVPRGVDTMLFYVANHTTDTAYFDDLEVIRYEPVTGFTHQSAQHLNIQLDNPTLQTLTDWRAKAMKAEVISDEMKEEFDAKIRVGSDTFDTSLRFKGDWTDHVKTAKWSYRIKIEDGSTIDRKRQFSIQHPNTRNYLAEWFLHEVFKYEGILTTAYDFVAVSENGIYKGIYAREEHFEKQLLESQDRREGVILKLDESLFWTMQLTKDEVYWGGLNISDIQHADILPFKRKKTMKSEVLARQFTTGGGLMSKLKKFDSEIGSYLDLDKYARFYAIQIIANTFHGTRWHNQRWYANPVTAKLEPIAYDCAIPDHETAYSEPVFQFLNEDPLKEDAYFSNFLYNNKEFCDILLKHLLRMTDPGHLAALTESISPELNENLGLLNEEFPRYTFSTDEFVSNAAKVREQLSDLENWARSEKRIRKKESEADEEAPLMASINIKPKVYTQRNGKTVMATVENLAYHKLTTTGYKAKGEDKKSLDREVKPGSKTSFKIESESTLRKLTYRYEGSEQELKVAVLPWAKPQPKTPRDGLTVLTADHYMVESSENGIITLRSGTHQIKELLLAPKGSAVVVSPGTELILNDDAGLICEGPMSMLGTEANPIKIHSTSKENHGITILQADGKCELAHVHFNGLNTLHLENWQLTGAVNFYESDVTITSCRFESNICEDALNIIRSDFDVSQCLFKETFSDAFDSDFCTGKLSNSRFVNTSNDAIDFSGSQVDISECSFINIGDKAVSGGEQSTLNATGLTVDGAVIGVASKDLSEVSVSNSSISKCDYGYVAYLKKPEYGGAKVKIDNVTISNLKNEYDIELNSSMLLNGKLIEGKEISKIEKY